MSDTAVKTAQTSAPNPLGTERIGKLMARYAVPSVVALVVNTIYNMVDQIFIGQGVGYLGNAATNVVMPLMTIIVAFGLLFGDGAAAYMSLMLGRGKPEKAAQGVGNAMIMIVIVGILFSVFFSIFIEPLCWLFGATDTNIEYCLDYGRVIAAGSFLSIIAASFGSIYRADGRPKITMAGLLIGCATNFICDPLFIFVFHWGVRGAALATVLGQCLNAIFFIFCAFRFKLIKMKKSCFILKAGVLKKISSLGVSSFITQAAVVIVMILMNNLLVFYGEQSKFGPDIPLAVYGIVMKVSMLINAVVSGIATGCQPIWGYNYGSEQYDRVKKCIKRALGIGFLVAVIGWAIVQIFPEQLINIFGAESELYVEFAVMCFRIYLLCIFMLPFCVMIGIFFQAIGKPVRAAFCSMSRQIIFIIPAMIIFGIIGGVEGLLWSGAFADLLAGIVALAILGKAWKKIFSPSKEDAVSASDGADGNSVGKEEVSES